MSDYVKRIWALEELITAAKLQNMEDGIDGALQRAHSASKTIQGTGAAVQYIFKAPAAASASPFQFRHHDDSLALEQLSSGLWVARKDVQLRGGADLVVFSDDGTTEKARIDGATGNITQTGGATVDGVDVSEHQHCLTVAVNAPATEELKFRFQFDRAVSLIKGALSCYLTGGTVAAATYAVDWTGTSMSQIFMSVGANSGAARAFKFAEQAAGADSTPTPDTNVDLNVHGNTDLPAGAAVDGVVVQLWYKPAA